MYINCVLKSRRYVEKGSKRAGGQGIYIVNLVAKLTGTYHALLRFWQNSAEFSGSGRVWQKYGYWILSVLVVETGGHVQGVTG